MKYAERKLRMTLKRRPGLGKRQLVQLAAFAENITVDPPFTSSSIDLGVSAEAEVSTRRHCPCAARS
ncbi:hypothetical protein QFZ83_006423 [Variovorax sp. W1I1]|uniref:hypothetical protein n=1 Tax=Variovorax sp. W1I1 TaxID=3042309 RepID=UPI00278ABFA4|nr:hypothetical protein [Variovorax sp. W1I1]MDQ0612252.1 hypothetical protein [Variovorax sp. W1I1]